MLDFNPQAKALFQMELRTTAEKTLPFTETIVQHLKSILRESAVKTVFCTHEFVTTQVDTVDKVLKALMTDGNPNVRYRVGLSTPTSEFWLPWQEHQIVHYAAMVRGMGQNAGHAFEITTADSIYTLNRPSRTANRQGTISAIVEQIAKDADLESVVEPTKEKYAYIQVNQSDVEFIRERLVNRAVNDKGRGQYYLYTKDNVLHFHSPDYQSTLRQISYYDAPHLGLMQIDRSQQLWDLAAAGTRMIVYDPYTGKSQELVSDPEKYLRMADGIYRLDRVKDGKQTLLFHLGQNQPSEASAIAQNIYSFGRSVTFESTINVAKSITVRLGDLLQFVLAAVPEKASPWSGYYFVSGIMRTVEKETMRTVYTLQRGETTRDQTTVTQTNDLQQLEPETTAPGQDINPATTQNSALTTGAGKQESSTVYVTVEDSEKAPGT